mgnify:CR=1 FL=1
MGHLALAVRAVDDALARVSSRLTRVEVHLADENAGKGGADDKRCMIEARPAGQSPVAVTNHAATLEEAPDDPQANLAAGRYLIRVSSPTNDPVIIGAARNTFALLHGWFCERKLSP